MQMDSHTRTLVVGLDAACWEYLDPLLNTRQLPNLARLIGQGMHGSLHSTILPITPVAWSSLATGVNAGKHGVFEWVRREDTGYHLTPVTADHRVGTTVWTRLNEAGVKVGVVNVPLTYPPQPLDGFLLCGFSAPPSARDLTHPPGLLDEVEARFGTYSPTYQVDRSKLTARELYHALRTHQRRIVEIGTALSKSDDVQVLILNLMLVDHSNHHMPTMDLVQRAVRDMDEDLGLLLTELSPDNVLVISDHGSRRVRGVFLLGAWLAEHGFLTRQSRPARDRPHVLNYVLEQWLGSKDSLLSAANRSLLREGLLRLPASLTKQTWRAIEQAIPLASMQIETTDSFVGNSTTVYMPGGNHGGLKLNLSGREPEGIVSEAESERILRALVDGLTEISDPDTGEPLFSRFYRAEELYAGPFVSHAPDLIADSYDSDWSLASTLPGLEPRPRRYFLTGERWYGDHARDGIYVFAGRDFDHLPQRGEANLLDIPATLLYLYDVPQPVDYDGQPLLHVFRNADRPIRHQAGDERSKMQGDFGDIADQEEEVLERLRQLGYLGE